MVEDCDDANFCVVLKKEWTHSSPSDKVKGIFIRSKREFWYYVSRSITALLHRFLMGLSMGNRSRRFWRIRSIMGPRDSSLWVQTVKLLLWKKKNFAILTCLSARSRGIPVIAGTGSNSTAKQFIWPVWLKKLVLMRLWWLFLIITNLLKTGCMPLSRDPWCCQFADCDLQCVIALRRWNFGRDCLSFGRVAACYGD